MGSIHHNFFVRQKLIQFLKYIYIIHISVYVYKSYSTTLDKGLRKNIKKIIGGEIRERKLNKWEH